MIDQDLPERADVVILGGGLAGAMLAHSLADRADVVLVEGQEAASAASAKSLGVVACGGADNPARLVEALGEGRARELWLWSRRACRNLSQLASDLKVGWETTGTLRFALSDNEASELRRSAELVRQWEGEGAARTLRAPPGDVPAGTTNFAAGMEVTEDGLLDVAMLRSALREVLTGRVVLLAGDASLEAPDRHGPRVSVGDALVPAEIVVVAAGAAAPGIHPWFSSCIYPVRFQAMRTTPVQTVTEGKPGLARSRFEAWLQRTDGRLEFVGCRWADPPEMGAGETDPQQLSDAVSARQQAFITRHLLGSHPFEVEANWAGIAGFSCDGLPLVGPLPGNPRLLSLTGWSGWGLSAIGAAVEDLAGAILGQALADSPVELLSPRRML